MNKQVGFLFLAAALAATLAASGCSKSPQPVVAAPVASAPAGHVTDLNVTEHVKSALQQNDALKGFNITVVTLKGDVRLMGQVDTQAHMDDAIRIARAADGAHTIHNEITVKP
jgi:hyperosmotically inducible protein